MHTAKAPPMEIAEDVRRITRSHMLVANVDRGGEEGFHYLPQFLRNPLVVFRRERKL